MESRSRKSQISPREYAADSLPATASRSGQHGADRQMDGWFGPPVERDIDVQDLTATVGDAEAGELVEDPESIHRVVRAREGVLGASNDGGELVDRGQRWSEEIDVCGRSIGQRVLADGSRTRERETVGTDHVHVRPGPAVGRGRRRPAGRVRGAGAVAVRRDRTPGRGDVGGRRRHHAPDPWLRQAGRGLRLQQGERVECAARGGLDPGQRPGRRRAG